MDKIIATIILCVAVTILMAPSTLAKTPDGETPANDGVCDVLEGKTPGLYGLCVAFCEAQDHPDILVGITEQDILALEDAAPSGRLLANYDRKKKAGDPAMPCIPIPGPTVPPTVPPPVPPPVTETCPCWPGAELAEIDGIMWNGSDSSSDMCHDSSSENRTNVFAYEIQLAADMLHISTVAQTINSSGSQQCAFNRIRNAPDGKSTAITLTVDQGTLTAEELAACTASLRDFQANSGFCP